MGSRGLLEIRPLFSLFLMKKPLFRGQKWLLRPYFPLIRCIFVLLKSGLTFSLRSPEVPNLKMIFLAVTSYQLSVVQMNPNDSPSLTWIFCNMRIYLREVVKKTDILRSGLDPPPPPPPPPPSDYLWLHFCHLEGWRAADEGKHHN